MANIEKQMKIYEECVKEIEQKLSTGGVRSLSPNDIKKIKITQAVLRYAKSIALRNMVIDIIKGNNDKIEAYVKAKEKELDDEIERLEKSRKKILEKIQDELFHGITNSRNSGLLDALIMNINDRKEKKQKIGEALTDPSYILSMIVSENKRPEFIIKEVMRVFEETLPFGLAEALLAAEKIENGNLQTLENGQINFFNSDGTINRGLVDLALSALGEGDLYLRIDKKRVLEKELKDNQRALDYIDQIPEDLAKVLEYNDEFKTKLKESISITNKIPTGLAYFVNNKRTSELEGRLQIVQRELRRLEKLRDDALTIFRRKQVMLDSLNTRFNREIYAKYKDIDANDFTHENTEDLREAYSKENIARYKETLRKRNEKIEADIRSINVGIKRDYRDLDPTEVSNLAYPLFKNNAEDKARSEFKEALKMLQTVDNLMNRRIKAKNYLTEEDKELIPRVATQKIDEIIEEDESYGMKM